MIGMSGHHLKPFILEIGNFEVWVNTAMECLSLFSEFQRGGVKYLINNTYNECHTIPITSMNRNHLG